MAIHWEGFFSPHVHFQALYNLVYLFTPYVFPSILDDIHIIGPTQIVSHVFEHFASPLALVGLTIQPHKCATWSPSTPSKFSLPIGN